MLQLIPIECNISHAHTPSSEVRNYFPLQGLSCEDLHLVQQEWPQHLGCNTMLAQACF